MVQGRFGMFVEADWSRPLWVMK